LSSHQGWIPQVNHRSPHRRARCCRRSKGQMLRRHLRILHNLLGTREGQGLRDLYVHLRVQSVPSHSKGQMLHRHLRTLHSLSTAHECQEVKGRWIHHQVLHQDQARSIKCRQCLEVKEESTGHQLLLQTPNHNFPRANQSHVQILQMITTSSQKRAVVRAPVIWQRGRLCRREVILWVMKRVKS